MPTPTRRDRPDPLAGRTVEFTVHRAGASPRGDRAAARGDPSDPTSALASWARRSETTTDLVLTPEQLHRRNLKHALAADARPRSSLRFAEPVDVARDVAGASAETRTLDRVDRLRLLDDVLAAPDGEIAGLRAVLGTDLPAHAEAVEAAREELDVVAGGHPARLDALSDVADSLPPVAAREAADLLDGVAAVGRELDARTDAAVSDVPVFRAGCDALAASDGAAWDDAFPTVERLCVAGVSTLGSALLDFLGHVAAFTDVEVHLFLRAATGPRIADRLGARLAAGSDLTVDVTGGTTDPSPLSAAVPTTEVVTTTRSQEARAAMAVVDALLARGVPVSDIALVARDVDRYERPLTRAARERGRHLSVWTQLALSRTAPYRLLVACVDLLAASARSARVDADTLFAPFDVQWVPPESTRDDGWPLAHRDVSAVRRAVDDGAARPLAAWNDRLAEADEPAADAVRALLRWVDDQPAPPTPRAAEETLRPLLDAYQETVLPGHLAADTPDLTETSRTAWAVERSRKLLGQVRGKYADWRDRGHVAASWETVGDVLDAVATTRPGRREHDNAERIDVLDATDTWLREFPYVVALGLVDGEWPERPSGAFPAELRDVVVAGTGPAATLGVRGAWTEARERDHFVDAVRTATEGLVCTRFTEDADGVSYHRSPLLDEVATDVVAGEGVSALLAADRRLPTPIRRLVDTTDDVAGGAESDTESDTGSDTGED